MPPAVLTIGHSNHPLGRLLALLARHEVEALVDIRRFPVSKKHPQFSRDDLAAVLPKSGLSTTGSKPWAAAVRADKSSGRGSRK
jgi:uncharacterized protein (DUF488 family)